MKLLRSLSNISMALKINIQKERNNFYWYRGHTTLNKKKIPGAEALQMQTSWTDFIHYFKMKKNK